MFWTARVPRDTGLSGFAPALHYVNIEYLNSQTPHNGAGKSAFSVNLSSCGLGFLEGGKKRKKVISSPCGLGRARSPHITLAARARTDVCECWKGNKNRSFSWCVCTTCFVDLASGAGHFTCRSNSLKLSIMF